MKTITLLIISLLFAFTNNTSLKAICPSTTDASTSEELCSGGGANPVDPNLIDPNGNAVEWFNGDPDAGGTALVNVDFTNETCDENTIVLNAYILCDDDEDGTTPDIYQDLVFTHTVTVYPASFTLTPTIGGCGIAASISITAVNGDECFSDTGTAPSNPACDSPDANSEPLAYDQTYFAGTACEQNFTGEVVADCAAIPCTNCPVVLIEAIGIQSFCSIDATDLSEASLGLTYEPTEADVSLAYYLTPGNPPSDIFVPGSLSATDECTESSTEVYAYLLCDLDGDGIIDEHTPAGSLTVEIYPDLSTQAVFVSSDGLCGPYIDYYDCQDITGYNITNDYDDNGANPDFSAECGSGAGAVNFVISNTNAPMSCQSVQIAATYNCTPNCDDNDCNTDDYYNTVTCECINEVIPLPDCDDNNCNTADSYDELGCECINTLIPPPNCDDGDCSTNDSYNFGICECINTPISPSLCDDGICETLDYYDTDICECIYTPAPPPNCDDEDCTTVDSFDEDACECVNELLPTPDCNDNDCNTEDVYDTTICECINAPISPPDCDDNDCNTDDTYNAINCECVNTPIPPPDCDDNNCTTADSYDALECECVYIPIPPLDCDDNDCNTDDVYNILTCECENNPITPPNCDDNDCNTTDSYDALVCECVYTPIPPPDCDDGLCYTNDSYDADSCDCVNDPITLPGCDDSNYCTTDIYSLETCECEYEIIPGCGRPIFGRAWEDNNQDGLQDATETDGIAEAIVELYDESDNLFLSTLTDEEGYYHFEIVPYGNYYMSMLLPSDYMFSGLGNGSAFDMDGQTALFEVAEKNSLSFNAAVFLAECEGFSLDYEIVDCDEELGSYQIHITATGATLGTNDFEVLDSPVGGFNGIFENELIDGPFELGEEFSYTISIVAQPLCDITIAEMVSECTTVNLADLGSEASSLNLSIYPLANGEYIQATFDTEKSSHLNWRIYNVNGQVVKYGFYDSQAGINHLMIPIDELTTGMYIFELTNGVASARSKWIR